MNAETGHRPSAQASSSVFEFTFGIYNQSSAWDDRRRLSWEEVCHLLTRHEVGPKVGSCIVPAVFSGTRRHKADAVRIDMAFLDSDAGYTLEEIAAALQRHGWAGIISSSHSHLATRTIVKRTNWDRYEAEHSYVEDKSHLPAAYLEEVKGYLDRVAIGARIAGQEGEHLVFEHSPCPKFRIALPLARPWLADQYPGQKEANSAWKERIEALATALRLDHDQACTDTSRLFYLPRRLPDAPAAESQIIDGQRCDIFSLRGAAEGLFEQSEAAAEPSPAPARKKRKQADDQIEYVNADTGEVMDLARWAKHFGQRFRIVEALKTSRPDVFTGLVMDGNKHHIRCPNEEEHTHAGEDAATFVIDATQGKNKGFVFHCRHGHCDGRERLFFLRKMLEQGWLKPDDLVRTKFLVCTEEAAEGQAAAEGEADGGSAYVPPLIRYVAGKLPEAVDMAEDALLHAGLGIYQRGPIIVRPGVVKVAIAKKGEADALRVLEVGPHALVEAMTLAADWEKYDGRSESWVSINAPMQVAETYRQRAGRWKLPVLTGVINAPTMRADGSILSQSGYDRQTGLLLDLRGVTFPAILDQPTTDDADQALSVLRDLIKTFPFKTEAHRSVALSVILTAVVRRSLPTAPMHAFTAPTAGSGKSKLVDIASVIATGREAGVIAQGKNEEEMEKRLGALLLAGEQIIPIDNCDLPVGGDTLCQMLTQTVVRARILGRSEAPELPANALVTATGNNLTLAGDMTRRALLCQIDPECERPELREFDFDPVERVKERRGEYLQAALTILRAYHVAGRPEQSKPLGSFRDWSRLVRDALIWVGEADPVQTMEEARTNDPKLAALLAVVEQWKPVVGMDRVSTRELVERATAHATGEWGRSDFTHPEFREALLDVAGDKGAVSTRRLAKWLGSQKGRVVNGLKIESPGIIDGFATWKLTKAGPA